MKKHESDSENWEMCGSCTGTGTKTEFRDGRIQTIKCSYPGCQDGSIKRPFRPPPPPPDPEPDPDEIEIEIEIDSTATSELSVKLEEQLAKAQQLKTALLHAIPSCAQLNFDTMFSADKLISSIDPLSKTSEESLEALGRKWSRLLLKYDPLLTLLVDFKRTCIQAEHYYALNGYKK